MKPAQVSRLLKDLADQIISGTADVSTLAPVLASTAQFIESYAFDFDAFSNGQIDSKLWMCEELEKINHQSNLTTILGGWYGLSAFLLLSRNKYQVKRIASYDIDPLCQNLADKLNENWVFKSWQFKAYTADCNTLDLSSADCVINTSSEHFTSLDWWHNIKPGTLVVVQSNNMPHEDHCYSHSSLDEFSAAYLVSDLLFLGEKQFEYPEWGFSRYMIIGRK